MSENIFHLNAIKRDTYFVLLNKSQSQYLAHFSGVSNKLLRGVKHLVKYTLLPKVLGHLPFNVC